MGAAAWLEGPASAEGNGSADAAPCCILQQSPSTVTVTFKFFEIIWQSQASPAWASLMSALLGLRGRRRRIPEDLGKPYRTTEAQRLSPGCEQTSSKPQGAPTTPQVLQDLESSKTDMPWASSWVGEKAEVDIHDAL